MEELSKEELEALSWEYLGKKSAGSRKATIRAIEVAKRNEEIHETISRLAEQAGNSWRNV